MNKPQQCITLLLAALHQLRGIRTKQDTLDYVQHQHWFDLQPNDWEPYRGSSEPRWHTMIAEARNACVQLQLMFSHDEIDHWEITRKGLEQFQRVRSRFATGELHVIRCYLWSPTFKLFMCPTYHPSPNDWLRPELQDYT